MLALRPCLAACVGVWIYIHWYSTCRLTILFFWVWSHWWEYNVGGVVPSGDRKFAFVHSCEDTAHCLQAWNERFPCPASVGKQSGRGRGRLNCGCYSNCYNSMLCLLTNSTLLDVLDLWLSPNTHALVPFLSKLEDSLRVIIYWMHI